MRRIEADIALGRIECVEAAGIVQHWAERYILSACVVLAGAAAAAIAATLEISLRCVGGQHSGAYSDSFGRQGSRRLDFMAAAEAQRAATFSRRSSIRIKLHVVRRRMAQGGHRSHGMIAGAAGPRYCDFWIDFRCARSNIVVDQVHVMVGVVMMRLANWIRCAAARIIG